MEMDPIFTCCWFGLEVAANFWLALCRGPRSPADSNLITPWWCMAFQHRA